LKTKLTATLLIAGLLLPSALWAQDDEQLTADPTEHLESLTAGLKARKTNDDDLRHDADTKIVEALDLLLLDFRRYDEKQQKEVIKAISKIFKIRTQENEDRIYIAAAACLSDIRPEPDQESQDQELPEEESETAARMSEMGSQAAKEIKSAMNVKHLEKRGDVQVVLIEALGKHRNEKDIEFFVKLMRSNEDKIVVAAINSLSQFRDSKPDVRKEIAEELVKQYANTNNLNNKEKGKNPVFKDRFYAIEVPMNEALAAITLQSFQSPEEWEKWYNDNRNKRW